MSYIAVVDYGAGNLMSVANTLKYLGYESRIAQDTQTIEIAAGVILPGVGAFPDAMQALAESGLIDAVKTAANTKPFLGICLGMQMLFESSDEVRQCEGLGLLEGNISRIQTDLILPQIGWNELEILRPNALTKGLKTGDHVYFVHSFMANPKNKEDLACILDFCTLVLAMVSKNFFFVCQFHPEKSGEIGLKIIKNFVELTEVK